MTHSPLYVLRWAILSCFMAVLSHGYGAHAQEYPQRALTLSVATDTHPALASVAELMATYMRTQLGRNVTVQKITKVDTQKFIQGINSLQNQGYNLALVRYPQVLAYDLGLWQKEERLDPFNWSQDLLPLARMAFDPLVFVTDPAMQTQPLKFMASLQAQKLPVKIAVVDDAVDHVKTVTELSMLLNVDVDMVLGSFDPQEVGQILVNKEASLGLVSMSRLYEDLNQESLSTFVHPMLVAGPVIHPQLPYTQTLMDLGIDKVFGQHYVLVLPTGVPSAARKVLETAMKSIKKNIDYRTKLYELGLFPSDEKSSIRAQTQKTLDTIAEARENNKK